MRRIIFVLLSLVLLLSGAYLIYNNLYVKKNQKDYASLSVNTPYADAGVFFGEEYLGPTPFYRDDLAAGNVELRVGDWAGTINLPPNTLTVVNQDLGPALYTGGDIIWPEKTPGEISVAFISEPDGAFVKIDGEDKGETPLRVSDISLGEHKVEITKKGYVDREVRIRLQEDCKLNVSSNLMKSPLPEEIKLMETAVENLTWYDFRTEEQRLYGAMEEWLKGLAFFFKSYGFNSEHKPDYFVSTSGNVYSLTGELLSLENYAGKHTLPLVIGYLGESGQEEISPEALTAVTAMLSKEGSTPPVVAISSKVKILPTGMGWLRVRSGPGLGYEEVQKVNEGEEYSLLEEQSGWVKIKVAEDVEGWVSSQFTEKI